MVKSVLLQQIKSRLCQVGQWQPGHDEKKQRVPHQLWTCLGFRFSDSAPEHFRERGKDSLFLPEHGEDTAEARGAISGGQTSLRLQTASYRSGYKYYCLYRKEVEQTQSRDHLFRLRI